MKTYTRFLVCASLMVVLTVVRNAMGAQLVLQWEAPATQTDQTAITNLIGYKVYFGTKSGSYESVITVSAVPQATICGLDAGRRYYFAVAAITSDDTEGILSDELIWDVPAPVAIPNLSMSVGAADTGSSAAFTLNWAGQAGKTYSIEVSPDLMSWQSASCGQMAVEQSTQTAVSDGTLTYCDVDASSAKQRFYRIQIR
jgi:hypothetical protein